jgi:hypothetical protein
LSCANRIRTTRFILGARQRLTTVSVRRHRPSWHGRRTCPGPLPCALVGRTAKIYRCRAPVFRRMAKTFSPCVYLSRAAVSRRTTKSGLCRASNRKRPTKELAHGKGRLSASEYIHLRWLQPCIRLFVKYYWPNCGLPKGDKQTSPTVLAIIYHTECNS